MRLSPGQKLGSYEIVAPIGEGGMGTVYRARDPRLARDVAVKCSAERFTERFAREARTIASLNHPNICTLHDVGPDYLVMELIDGLTLEDRIRNDGPIPMEESLRIANQIAEALEAAHEKGIVHRDLKPGNIKIRLDGTVKVLDFGLATGDGIAAVSADSPTMTGRSETGLVLGTAAYMSPEQARGKAVDKRADIWAFGVVLYEMLTGKRLHTGETASEVLAAVLKESPDLGRVPARLRPLLRSCLQKDPRQRLHDIADARLLLEVGVDERTPPAPSRPGWLWPAIAALLLLAVVGLVARMMMMPGRPVPGPRTLSHVPQPDGLTFNVGTHPAISPNAQWIAFAAIGPDKRPRIYSLDLGNFRLNPLPGSEGIYGVAPPPFFSDDGQTVFYGAKGQLRASDVRGIAHARTIATIDRPFVQGVAQNSDGLILYANPDGVLLKVTETGGSPVPVTALTRGETAHRWPQFLPGGRRFLYQRVSGTPGKTGVFVGSLDVRPDEQSLQPLLTSDRQAVWVASPDGTSHVLLFIDGSNVLARPFDPETASLPPGGGTPVTGDVGSFAQATAAMFSVARNGTIAYRSGGSSLAQTLVWRDIGGTELGTLGGPELYASVSLSPNGRRAAIAITDSQGNQHISLQDANDLDGRTRRQLTWGVSDSAAVWRGNDTIIYASKQGEYLDLYQQSVDNRTEKSELVTSSQNKTPTSVSSDGRFLLFTSTDPETGLDVWIKPLDPPALPCALLKTRFNESAAVFSPDARWVTYTRRSSTTSIYLRPFSPDSPCPKDARREDQLHSVSKDRDGTYSRWDTNGSRVYYVSMDLELMAVDMELLGSEVRSIGMPSKLFDGVNPDAFALTRDRRFLFRQPPPGPAWFGLLQHWMEHLTP
jgi:Tol biopolymer transport system component